MYYRISPKTVKLRPKYVPSLPNTTLPTLRDAGHSSQLLKEITPRLPSAKVSDSQIKTK